jgi:triosephosphate isomerase
MRRKLAAGNWKMNGLHADLREIAALAEAMDRVEGTDVLICPPAPLLRAAVEVAGASGIEIGGQDCHTQSSGAHTGDISAAMIRDTGARYVILGHSERRADHGETSDLVRAKAEAAMAAGLLPVICVGETEAERDAGATLEVLGAQLAASCPDGVTGPATVIAYEPVWAIGTGRTAESDQIAEVHDFLRAQLVERFGAEGDLIRLLYGGSVKAGNAAGIFAVDNVDGALVGGASLTAADFAPIVKALQES